ncbi:MAG: complex I subunit 1 family protein [Bacteroidota bacterium]
MTLDLSYGSTLFTVLTALVKIVALLLGFGMGLASILTWMERRQSAMMQDRLGPNRANIGPFRAWGITHFLADALKFLFKEDFVPPMAHKFFFMWAPVMAMAPALIVAAIIPFGAPVCWGHAFEAQSTACETPVLAQIARLDVGILFYFALSSLAVYGATLAGWASHNKWAMMGGMRASSQMMSYEVTMGMAVLGAFLVYGTLEPGAMVMKQQDSLFHWGIVTQPLGFFLFLTASIAETKRTPFDIPEGEPEIIGYFVEYSGLRFGMFFLGEFLEIVFSSALMVSIFLGGWSLPGVQDFFVSHQLPNALYVLATVGIWSVKVFLFSAFQLLIRWSLPRFRSDQLMQLGWQRLLPISIANVVATALVVLWLNTK